MDRFEDAGVARFMAKSWRVFSYNLHMSRRTPKPLTFQGVPLVMYTAKQMRREAPRYYGVAPWVVRKVRLAQRRRLCMKRHGQALPRRINGRLARMKR